MAKVHFEHGQKLAKALKFESIKFFSAHYSNTSFFQLGDRIIHSFFQPDHYSEEDCDRLEFHDFIKVLAHFRPLKKEKHGQRNILNSRRDKLKSKFFHFNPF